MKWQPVCNLFPVSNERNLRSIVKYEHEAYEITYLREDVSDQYTKSEIEAAIRDSRFDSIAAPVYEDIYSDDHGDITCLVQCFENVVEMNFVLEDGVGAAVALDSDTFAEAQGLVAEAREIVLDERNGR